MINFQAISSLEVEQQLLGKIQYQKVGDNQFLVDNICDINENPGRSIVWIGKKNILKVNIQEIRESVVILPGPWTEGTSVNESSVYIFTDNPRLAYCYAVSGIFQQKKDSFISSSAVIDSDAQIGKNVYIGPGVVLGKCIIGDNTVLLANIYVHNNTRIGANVKISPGVVIGSESCGFEKNDSGEWIQFPQLGGVIIEDNVHIGANSCIDRGAIGNTVVRKGAKIDSMVHIAHNVDIGQHTMVISHTSVAGSTRIGEGTWLSPGSVIKNGLSIGSNVFVGIGSVVLKNIKDSQKVFGNPALNI